MNKIVLAAAAGGALLMAGTAAFAYPTVNGHQPGVLITLTNAGATVSTVAAESPFDGIEDTYVGVVNNSTGAVSALNLSSTQNIFGFDGDGLKRFDGTLTNIFDASGYGGTNAFFTVTNVQNGVVHFITPIAPGSTSYFSLEERVGAADFTHVGNGVPEPTTWAMMMLGFFGMGALLRRDRRVAA